MSAEENNVDDIEKKELTAEELKELGNKEFGSKNYKEAIAYYNKAILVDKMNHILFSNRSASYGGLGDWKSACDDAKECIKLEPSFIKGYYRLATAQVELKEYDSAISTINQGLAIEKNNAQLLKLLKSVKQTKKAVADAATRQLQQQQSSSLPPGALGRNLDSGTLRELQDLQLQYGQTNREYNTVQANLVKSQRECKIFDITKEELEKLQGSNCYQSVGKMFLKSTKTEAMDTLNNKLSAEKKKQADMASKLQYLERRMKSQSTNIQELLQSANS